MKKRKLILWAILLSAILILEACVSPSVKEITAACVQIPAPAPLAQDIKLDIYQGDLLTCNAGCEKLLREYAGTREAILEAWPPK